MAKKNQITVAKFLEQQINIADKSQKEIAAEIGYEKPNVITMFKQGLTKVPINKVPAFAKALGVDPIHFLRLTMSEYMPETWEVIEELLGKTMISESELEILKIIRSAGGGQAVAPENSAEKAELVALVEKWRKHAESHADASRRRVERERKKG